MRGKTGIATIESPLKLQEKHFQKQVLDLAKTYHWLCFHTYDSRLSVGTGYPDLCMTRGGRILYCELKTERGRLRPEQKIWLEALSTCVGVEVYTWRPSQMDEIIEVLK